ncbi:hypothetical protein BJI47_13645 [Rhodococcus sp. 1168]|nr:hypothetical protein BJI47_13645 [Rhodococcus sp. 1168]
MRELTAPERVGLPTSTRRRVPGLRREELAALAGLSPTYYTRLEQSQPSHASMSVLLSISRALGLNNDEEAYLLKVGRAPDQAVPQRLSTDNRISPATKMLVESHRNVAAAILNYRCDILAWNTIFHNLIAPHLNFDAPAQDDRPNMIELNFLDPAVQALYGDWGKESLYNVSYFRCIAGDHRNDTHLASTIDRLIEASPDFAALWDGQHVENCTEGTKTLNHPHVGTVELMYQSADLRDGNIMKIYHAIPESDTEQALISLGAADIPQDEVAARRRLVG